MKGINRSDRNRAWCGRLVVLLAVLVTTAAAFQVPAASQKATMAAVHAIMRRDAFGFAWFRPGGYPGPWFYETHADALGLSADEVHQIRHIRQQLWQDTLTRGGAIDEQKVHYRHLLSAHPANLPAIRTAVSQIANAEARLTRRHFAAHVLARQVLTTRQQARLERLLAPTPTPIPADAPSKEVN